jgi:predicted Fe-S protein YdhL (DUF1289 family)
MDEIMSWGQASEADKRRIWQQLSQRQQFKPFPEAGHNPHIRPDEDT